MTISSLDKLELQIKKSVEEAYKQGYRDGFKEPRT